MKKYNKGFTLIELMIVVVIIGLIMAYAIPSYQRQVIVSKRTEAQNAIMQIAAAEEKHNGVCNVYTTTIAGSGNDCNSLGLGGAQFMTSTNYTFSVAVDAAVGYTISGVARAGSTQVNDNFGVNCTTLQLNALGQKLPLDCWQ